MEFAQKDYTKEDLNKKQQCDQLEIPGGKIEDLFAHKAICIKNNLEENSNQYKI